jgi:hypothetical protein
MMLMQSLTTQLRRCTSWQQLQELFLQQRSCMNHIHLSALMVRLAQLVGKNNSHSSSSSSRTIHSGLGSTAMLQGGSHHPLSKGGKGGDAGVNKLELRPFLAQLVPHVGMQLLTFGPRQLSNTMWALGR